MIVSPEVPNWDKIHPEKETPCSFLKKKKERCHFWIHAYMHRNAEDRNYLNSDFKILLEGKRYQVQ